MTQVWERHMTHQACGKCLRAARFAKTDTIVEDMEWATQTVVDTDNGSEHTATVIRREAR